MLKIAYIYVRLLKRKASEIMQFSQEKPGVTDGGADETRTRDLLTASQAFYVDLSACHQICLDPPNYG